MGITKSLSFGMLVLSTLMMGFYLQSQVGNKSDVNNFFDELKIKTQEIIEINYPKDLIIKVINGNVTLNQKLPYCLVLDKKLNGGIVFDGSESLNIKTFSEQPKNFSCKPFAIVGKNFVGGKPKENGEIRAWQIPAEFSVEINQNSLVDFRNQYLPMVEKQGKSLYTLLPLILFLATLPWIMLANFWYSLVIYLLAKLFKLTNHPEIKNRYWLALFFGSILSIINTVLAYTLYPQISFFMSGSIIIGSASIIYVKYFSEQIVEVEVVKTEITKKKK